MQTGSVRTEQVSHGSGSVGGRDVADPNHDGMLDRCNHGSDPSNRRNMTRVGFFRTHDLVGGPASWPTIDGAGNQALRMHGLTPGANEESFRQSVVMHAASYNRAGATMGRTWGCPGFTTEAARRTLPMLAGGSLYYSYVPQCGHHQSLADRQVSGWQGMCD